MAEARGRGSLRARLALAFIAVAIAAVAALAVVMVVATQSETSRLSAGDRARTATEVTRALAGAYGRSRSWSGADFTAAEAVASEADAVLVVRASDGSAVLGPPGLAAGARGTGSGPVTVTEAVEVDGQRVGTAELRFRRSLTHSQSVLRNKLSNAVVFGSAIAVVVALIGAAVVSRAITIPLRRLAGAARRLQEGDLAARAGVAAAPGELGQLSGAFDGMAETLEREREARRRLISDLAHEIRTPVAVLQGNLEELVDAIADPTPQRLGSLHEEALRLGALIEDLDALARADAPVTVMNRVPVDLGELARAQIEALRPRPGRKGAQDRVAAGSRHCARRPRTPGAGAGEPGRERGEVHARGRSDQCARGFG
jgi:two-component system, OmpR family, sensor histidine kinase BaeS